MFRLLTISLILLLSVICLPADNIVYAQTILQDTIGTTTQSGRVNREGRGMAVGALAGAALGSFYGEAGAGAAAGAVAGGLYSYDQRRQDERTMMLADAISSNQQPAAAPPPSPQPAQAAPAQSAPVQSAPARPTVGDLGRLGLRNFTGDWNVETWVLTADGQRLVGSGRAKGMAAGEDAVRVLFTEYRAEAFPNAKGGGHVLLTYKPGQGFFLESKSGASDEALQLVGEFVPDRNQYEFYLVTGVGSEGVTGIIRSSVRVTIRSTGAAMWVAETFAFVEGEEKQIQSFRFIRA